MSDELIVFTNEELFGLLGEFALPPWKDDNGNVLGEDINCARIASELVQAVQTRREKNIAAFRVQPKP